MNVNPSQIVLVKDINPGFFNDDNSSPKDSYPSNFIEFKDKLYFRTDNEEGRGFWVSDSTAEGTELVKDLFPRSLIEFNDKLYFSGYDDETGEELWASDGTAEGTQLVIDLTPGISEYGYANSSEIGNLVELNGKLYFSVNDYETDDELWVTNGTAEGTQLVANVVDVNNTNYYGRNITEFSGKLYFSADVGETGSELWVTDGTAEGTQLVVDLFPGISNEGYANSSEIGYLTEFNGKLYFSAYNSETGFELWVTDGTAEGTQLVKDINPGYSSSSPFGFTEFNGKLYFSADDGETGFELWVTDGTPEGTKLVKDINPGTDISYGYDGSAGEVFIFPASSDLVDLVEFNNLLYFAADDGETGEELWVTDGTPKGTQLVADINPKLDRFGDGSSSYPGNLTVVGDELFFSANNGETGHELYKLTFDASGMEIENIAGTNLADILVGDEGDDNIKGLQGDDTLGGKAGNDDLDGDAGNDVLFGVDGDDTLTGGNGDDLLRGQSGNDVLDGGEGNDTLFGGNQFDRLNGYDGNDFLDGGRGVAIYNGGLGSDRFVIRDDAQIWVQDFELDVDVIEFTGSMTFEEIEITGRINSFISFQGEQVGVLLGVNPQDLDRSHFQE